MHPTSKLNAVYAQSIVQILIQNKWPQRNLVPNKDLPLYTKEWEEPWSKIIPEPINTSKNVRPDNMSIDIK